MDRTKARRSFELEERSDGCQAVALDTQESQRKIQIETHRNDDLAKE